MNQESIISALATRQAGQLFHVSMRRPCKTRKGVTANITKASKFTCQLSSYARRGPVREAVESGDREAPQTPSWVVKSEERNGLRFWYHANGQAYLAAPVVNLGAVEFERDGKPATLSDLASELLASELKEKDSKEELAARGQVRFVAVKLENILEVK